MFKHLGIKGKLNAPCLPGGNCTDTNTLCYSGICLCRSAFYEKNTICSEPSCLSQVALILI